MIKGLRAVTVSCLLIITCSNSTLSVKADMISKSNPIHSPFHYEWSQDGQIYYENGKKVTGAKYIDGYWYYFDEKTGVKTTGFKYIESMKGTAYYDENGHLLFGEQFIDGFWYYFESNGLMAHEFKYLKDKDITVWYGAETGHMLFGEYRLYGHWYYLDDVTGGITYGWKELPDKGVTYYYDSNGWKVFGNQVIDGISYEFDEETGALIDDSIIENGWNVSKDMFYENGEFITGVKKIDNYWYYFDESTGIKITSSFKDIRPDYRVYYDEDGHLVFGTKTIDGVTYEFNKTNGALISDNSLQNGWDEDQDRYFQSGVYITGAQKIGNYWYYFDESTGKKLMSSFKDIKPGYRVYYDSEGHLVFGTTIIDGVRYVFDRRNGNLLESASIQNGWNPSKDMFYEDWEPVKGSKKIDGYWYYFDENGKKATGFKYIEAQKGTVYYDSEGRLVFGTRKIGSYWYYFDNRNGNMVKSAFKYIPSLKGTAYYDADGHLQFGQKKIDGNWYYFADNGILQIGKVNIPASNNSGVAKTIVTDTGGRYILNNIKKDGYYYTITGEGNTVTVGAVTKATKIYAEGIDISEFNYNHLKEFVSSGEYSLSDYKNGFVIIRASWSDVKDKKVDVYVKKCEQLGVPYGFYVYTYARNNSGAKEEAEFFLTILNDLKKNNGGRLKYFKYGVWCDMEDADTWKRRNGFQFTNANIGGICYTFCSTISSKGYYTGIYMSQSWLKYLSGTKADNYDKWVAHWGRSNNGLMQSDMSGYGSLQQYTSYPNLDRDVMFKDPSGYKNGN